MLVGTFLHGTLKGSNEIDFLKLTRRSNNLFCHAKLFFYVSQVAINIYQIILSNNAIKLLEASHLFLKINDSLSYVLSK